MKAFQKILNQPNYYLIQFEVAWKNLLAVEKESKFQKLKTTSVYSLDLAKNKV